MIECQSFRQGCCGCCVNMRWSPERVKAFLGENTREFAEMLSVSRPRFRDLVRFHWRRRGWRDHIMLLLAPFTLGLTAWLWQRYLGSCCFAGYLEPETNRAGCLIHPLRIGKPDLRRHAFPGILVLGCNRELICPMLKQAQPDLSADLITVSSRGFRSLRGMTAGGKRS